MSDTRVLRTLILGALLCLAAVTGAARPFGPDSAGTASAVQDPDQDAGPTPADRWWTRVYAAGFYDTRWDGWFLQSYGQRGYDFSDDRKWSLYGIGMLTTDTKSSGAGTLPVIISDNVFIIGAGVRYKPVPWIWFDAQEGVAFDLLDRADGNTVRNDFRLLATGGAGIYPEYRVHDDVQAPLSLMADCFGSFGYYSRYENVISYLQGRVGARAMEVSTTFLDVYLRGDFAFDTDGDYYNNIYEIGPGLRFTPNPDWGLFLMIEYRSGHYADWTDAMRQERALYFPADYEAWRFFLVFDRTF